MPGKLWRVGLCGALVLLSGALPVGITTNGLLPCCSAAPALQDDLGHAGRITLHPTHPTPADSILVTISGLWGSSCPVATCRRAAGDADFNFCIEVSDLPPPAVCLTIVTEWAITETLGTLSPGSYTIRADVRAGSCWSFQRMLTFTVATTMPVNLDAVEGVYPLTPSARTRLLRDGLVVLGDHDGDYLSSLYMSLFARPQVSVFVTSDALLHVYHVVFDDLLQIIEEEHLRSDVQALVTALAQASLQRYDSLPEEQPRSKAAARHAVLFFSVACRLLDPSYALPACVASEAQAYIDKILAATAFEYYPGDDYTQYQPRGHYASNAQLEAYFRAIKWLGRHIFRITDLRYPQEADDEIASAALIAQLLQEDTAVRSLWQNTYDVTRLLANPADSITPPLVWQAVTNVFGASFSLAMLENQTNIERLRQEFQRDAYPTSQIIPVPTQPGQIPPKYIQFMGERYVPDGEAMRKTCFPCIPNRSLPSGLDVADAVLGSERARQLLAPEMACYPQLLSQLTALRREFDAWSEQDWTTSAYNRWLYTLRPLVAEPESGAVTPPFMSTDAWRDEKVNTVLASWTQLRHDYILYAKPTYVPMPWCLAYGYVEPIPAFYARLSALCHALLTDLGNRGWMPAAHGRSLQILADKCDELGRYARKIVAGEALSETEQASIHSFGVWLLSVFAQGIGVPEEEPVLIADVATNSLTEQVLYEAVGHFNPVIIIYPQPDGQSIAGIGYVMSYYEFNQVLEPGGGRLTDAQWRARLDSPARPSRPAWTASFIEPPFTHVEWHRLYLPWVARDDS